MKNSETIGRVLKFNKNLFERVYYECEVRLTPLIHSVIETYGKLGIGEFAPDELEAIASNEISKIEKRYMQQAEDDTSKFKNASVKASLLQNAREDLKRFVKEVENLHIVVGQLNATYEGGDKIRLTDYFLKEKELILNKAIIEERCTTRIINEKQAELYDNLSIAIKQINHVAALIRNSGHRMGIVHLLSAATHTNEKGEAEINPNFIIDIIRK